MPSDLTAHLQRSGISELAPSDLETLDLKTYLQETALFGPQPGLRLRHLAIWLEEELLSRALHPRPWRILSRIYDLAERYDPNAVIFQSRGISARHCADHAQPSDQAALRAEALTSLQKALELDPKDAHSHFIIGILHYGAPESSTRVALTCFSEALKHAEHPEAALYRAHCLQDMEQWAEALEAYEKVDKSRFVGSQTWRVYLLRQQIAECRLQLGQVDRALVEFTEALRLYETLPKDEIVELSYLIEAAKGVFREQLFARVQGFLATRADDDFWREWQNELLADR